MVSKIYPYNSFATSPLSLNYNYNTLNDWSNKTIDDMFKGLKDKLFIINIEQLILPNACNN